jgi:hypothetical protein
MFGKYSNALKIRLIDYLNVVLAMNEQSHRYWNEVLIRKLERKFGVVALNAAERMFVFIKISVNESFIGLML